MDRHLCFSKLRSAIFQLDRGLGKLTLEILFPPPCHGCIPQSLVQLILEYLNLGLDSEWESMGGRRAEGEYAEQHI